MNDALFERNLAESHTERLSRIAKALRVPMTHWHSDDEFMPVLSYRVDREIAKAKERLANLERLRDLYTA